MPRREVQQGSHMLSFSTPYSWPAGGLVYAQGCFSRISVAPSISPRNGHTKGGLWGYT